MSIEADLAKVGMSYDTRTRVLEVAPGGNSMPITPFVKKVCTPLGRIRDVIWWEKIVKREWSHDGVVNEWKEWGGTLK